ncbi:MAG: DNA topoisomerase, partial [Chloroflexi bacterium]|nr:DNA topoisomerase [Chloroflexota bacterium]
MTTARTRTATARSSTKPKTAKVPPKKPVTRARTKEAAGADGRSLVVVESPAKARTIGRILGSDYHVMASLGHVRDLPDGKLGVEVDNDFRPIYEVRKEKQKIVNEVREASRGASVVYLATDPDREGEAISWHILEAAGIRPEQVRRVVFHEITADAIRRAFQDPREIDVHLVDAQQARRVLDRLVGYLLSPLLWQKVRRGLSAGRVQSAALRLVVDREREIEAFIPREYWTIEGELATLDAAPVSFGVRLQSLEGQRKAIEILDEASASRIVADLRPAQVQVGAVRRRETLRRPTAPFIT